MSLLKVFFTKSPFFIKRIFINAEAYRRDYFRRFGDYKALLENTDINHIMKSGYHKERELLFGNLMEYVSINVPRYKGISVRSLSDIEKIDPLTKADIRNNIKDCIYQGKEKKRYFKSVTSGSTGTAVSYYQDRESVRLSQLYAEKLLQFAGLCKGDKKARISGVSIIPFECEKPPFWVYIDKYRQLQLSSYHIKDSTCKSYIDAMIKHNITFGAGYATSWLFLAEYILSNDIALPKIKAIVSDSEGISKEKQKLVEKAFNCPMYQTYGLSETGQVAFCCKEGNYHIVPSVCFAEIVDEENKALPKGEIGQIVLTSLIAKDAPFIRYLTGDLGVMGSEPCKCGWETDYFSSIEGRLDDYVLTKDNRKIGRLSHIAKFIKGAKESQLIQTAPGKLIIRVVPDVNWDEESMKDAIKNAKNYIGDMDISWEIANELEKTKRGKVRYVIRKF